MYSLNDENVLCAMHNCTHLKCSIADVSEMVTESIVVLKLWELPY